MNKVCLKCILIHCDGFCGHIFCADETVAFSLEESQRIKDAFRAKQAGIQVCKLYRGKATMYFACKKKDTSREVLESGK